MTADLSIFHPDRAGEQNADDRTYYGVTCSLAEFYSGDDDYLIWYVRCRDVDDPEGEDIMVEQHRRTLDLRAYYAPRRFHRAALSFVRAEPECQDGDP